LSIPDATTFWIECGAMQGGSRNQLEMHNELAEFFGDEARDNEVLTIQLAPGVQYIRPFVYRGDDYGHWKDRWRMCLPTGQMGGPSYPERAVRFDKIQMGAATVFQLTVTDIDSTEHNDWRSQSTAPSGGSDTTDVGREYGWWS